MPLKYLVKYLVQHLVHLPQLLSLSFVCLEVKDFRMAWSHEVRSPILEFQLEERYPTFTGLYASEKEICIVLATEILGQFYCSDQN